MHLTAGNKKSLYLHLGLALASMGWISAQRASAATTIDFSSQTGGSGSLFTKDKQNGFLVQPTSGGPWFVSQDFGNPVPSIYDATGATSTLTVTDSGSLFTFKSIDYSSENTDTAVTFTGLDNGVTEFTENRSFPLDSSPYSFSTFSSSNADAKIQIDTLTITVAPSNSPSAVYIDNIKVAAAAVPEPTTACMMLGAGGLMLLRGKRVKNPADQ